MTLAQRIEALTSLGKQLSQMPKELLTIMQLANQANQWFAIRDMKLAIQAIAQHYLTREKLEKWLSTYQVADKPTKQQKIALVMAGNIPLVGFHDFLCVFVSGHRAQIKLSDKDKKLFPFVLQMLCHIAPKTTNYIEIVPKLQNFDAVIATGSNNSARYFEYYFGKYPNIIRKSRSSVAILSGQETAAEVTELGKDIFTHCGLGCRSVSKLFVPKDYNFNFLLENLKGYGHIMAHPKYRNNYDYQLSLLIINKVPHIASPFVILREKEMVASAVATLNYSYYENEDTLNNQLIEQHEAIQCVVGNPALYGQCVPFGQAQEPALWEYADKVDTLQFCLSLS